MALSAAGVCCALLFPSTGPAAETRTWTSSDGKTVVAELLSATDTTVTIRNDAGREFTFPHERLSQADREVIQAHLAKRKADYDDLKWPKPNPEEAIKAPFFKRLHTADAKKFSTTYAGRILRIEGQVLEVKEDRMSASGGVIVVLDTEDKIPVELKLNKSSYEKDLTLLLDVSQVRNRGPYNEDEFRVSVQDKSLIVERRYVISRDYYYTDTLSGYRYRSKWSNWELVAKPAARGETVNARAEFVSVFNSAMSFKDACLLDPRPVSRSRVVVD